MEKLVKAAWAGVVANEVFICIRTYSGYRSSRADPKGATHYLDANVGEMELGSSLLDALNRSRFVLPAPRHDVWTHPDAGVDPDLYDLNATSMRYEEWVDQTMKLYGYKTRKALFKNLHSCSCECQSGTIKMQPMKKAKGEGWTGPSAEHDLSVKVAFGSSPEAVGAALRLALSRCT